MERSKDLPSQLKILFTRGIGIYRENKMSVYSGYATLFIVTAVFPCIILIISVVNLIPGYSAQASQTEYNYDQASDYIEAGYVYIYAGCRGRKHAGSGRRQHK